MNRLNFLLLILIISSAIYADTEAGVACLIAEKGSGNKSAYSASCIESSHPKIIDWCAKMAESNSITKKYVISTLSCRSLGFPGKPQKSSLGDLYNCNFLVPALNECNESMRSKLDSLIQF